MPTTPEFVPAGGTMTADPVLERLVRRAAHTLGVDVRIVPVAAVTATATDPGAAGETAAFRYVEYPVRTTTGLVVAFVLATAGEPRVWPALDRLLLETLAETVAARAAGLVAEREHSLREARAEFDRVIHNVNDYVRTVEVLAGGKILVVFASPNAKEVFGTPPGTDDDLNVVLGDLVHPEDQAVYQVFHEKILLAGEPAELECRLVGLDGVTRWISTHAAPRREGDRLFVDGITRNITDRKESELALQEERRRLRQAQMIGRTGSWEWDLANDQVTWSETMFDLYGVDPAKFTAQEANRHCIHPEDLPGLIEQMRASARTGAPLHHRYRVIRPRDGRVRMFEARAEAIYGTGLKPQRLAGTSMDITEAVRAQKESTSREAMLRAILANSQSLIYVKRLDGRYLMANEPLLRLLNTTEAELVGRTDLDLNPELGRIWQANDRRAQQGEFTVEEYNDGPDGRHYYDSVKFPLHDADGRLYATCGISLDVTARRNSAQAMAEARDAALAANAAKSSFLATMSHEIRTPMNAVIGMTDLLLDTPLDSRQLEYVETVRTSGNALLAVINDILDFSRIEAGEIELEDRPFDLRGCLEDSLSLVAGSAVKIDLIADVAPGVPRFVRGDVNRLRQVLVNLVSNAVKFTEQGEVLISITPGPPGAGPDRTGLSFSVRDSGIGIPPDRMDRLFKSFSQVDASTTRVYGGSGLGLAISRAIVRAMGGDISVTSEVGHGSTFGFELALVPCADDDPGLPTGTDRAGPDRDLPDLSGRRVLVVDDNPTSRRVLRSQIESWGLACTDVGSALEALDLLQTGTRFDLAVLDLNMPDIGGIELAGLIRPLPAGRRLPMILLTSLESAPGPATPDLFDGFHTKPVRAATLRATVGHVLAPPVPVGPDRRPEPATAGPEDGVRLRVLLAEDNEVNQKVALGMLRKLGHVVTVAADGRQALQAVERADYDVVLMDIHMPTMDGLDATRAIRAGIPAPRQPRIVAMTASSLPEDQQACVDAGMDGYLLKPVRMADLARTLLALPEQPTRPVLPPGTSVPVPDRAADPTDKRADERVDDEVAAGGDEFSTL